MLAKTSSDKSSLEEKCVCVSKVINSAVDLSHGDNIFKDAKPSLNTKLWGLQQQKLFITLYVYL